LDEGDDGYDDAMSRIESMMDALGFSMYDGMPLYLDEGNHMGGGDYGRFGNSPWAQGARGNSRWASGAHALTDDLNLVLGALAGAGYNLQNIWRVRLKIELHGAHHTFGRLGKRKHIQMMIYRQGVKGSHKILRIPLPK